MENSQQYFREILEKLQAYLNELKVTSETRVSDKDAVLYGKFSRENEKYTVVIQVREESYQPSTASHGKIRNDEDNVFKLAMPSLHNQVNLSQSGNCSEKAHLEVREKFLAKANEISREFYKTLNQ